MIWHNVNFSFCNLVFVILSLKEILPRFKKWMKFFYVQAFQACITLGTPLYGIRSVVCLVFPSLLLTVFCVSFMQLIAIRFFISIVRHIVMEVIFHSLPHSFAQFFHFSQSLSTCPFLIKSTVRLRSKCAQSTESLRLGILCSRYYCFLIHFCLLKIILKRARKITNGEITSSEIHQLY